MGHEDKPEQRTASHSNALARESSPYLLQHAGNPVDWLPWGTEAFDKARREDKPVFLSVGYSTCHWCHVMERESFENPEIARRLNRDYVAVKVDREERPDLDEIYMAATQILTGQGGWPNSVWLTPDARPWFAGTYFPPEDRYGRIGFGTILDRLAALWRERREDIEEQARQLTEAVRQLANADGIEDANADGIEDANASGIEGADAAETPASSSPATAAQDRARRRASRREIVERLLRQLESSFDWKHGGFGGAPKFPPHGSLAILLSEYERSNAGRLLDMAVATLDGMASGGLRDHVGGGFHRYATDERWFLPHFEKMLSDNAQLARVYLRAFVLTGEARHRRAALAPLDWILRDMTSPEGGFHSALDADSEGEEGRFYLWTPEQVAEVIGETEARFVCKIFNITSDGNYREEATGHRPGSSLPHLGHMAADIALQDHGDDPAFFERLDRALARLREARDCRIRPFLDDKILCAWNGLAIAALAEAGTALDTKRELDAADRAADFLLANLRTESHLLHAWRGGNAMGTGFLDDYAFLAEGLLELHRATGSARRLDEARALVDAMIERFHDPRDGVFFYAPRDREDVLMRSKDTYDKAIPSGNGMAAQVLLRLARLTNESRFFDLAARLLDSLAPVMRRSPRGTESLIFALARLLDDEEVFAKSAAPAPSASPPPPSDSDAPEGGIEATSPCVRRRRKPLRLELRIGRARAAFGETIPFALQIAIDDGWHLNAHAPTRPTLLPTRLELAPSPDEAPCVVHIENIEYPEGTSLDGAAETDTPSLYTGTIRVVGGLRLESRSGRSHSSARASASGARCDSAFVLHAHPCTDGRCLAPMAVELPFSLDVLSGGEASD